MLYTHVFGPKGSFYWLYKFTFYPLSANQLFRKYWRPEEITFVNKIHTTQVKTRHRNEAMIITILQNM